MSGQDVFDVIVVGVGATGAATCMQLATRGLRVLGIEQFEIPNSRGSVNSHSRAIRLSYFEHPNYVRLLRRAFVLWQQLEERANEGKLLHVTGAVYAGPPEGSVVDGCIKAAREHELQHDVWDAMELNQEYPQFTLPADFHVFYEAQAGFISALDAVKAMTRIALENGCEIRANERAVGWKETQGAVQLSTDRGTYHCGALIVCAGGWAPQWLQLPVDLSVTRQFTTWNWPASPADFRESLFPIFGIELVPGINTEKQASGYFYGFPMTNRELGFKAAVHRPGEICRPEDYHQYGEIEARESAVEIARLLHTYVPKAAGPLLANKPCIYTNTPDGHFVVDRHPDARQVYVAAGLSGHGFKFATVLGEVLADLAEHGATEHDVDFLSLNSTSRPK